MDTVKTLLQLETAKDGGFSHSEALRISGLTAERLLTWYKRGADKMPKDLAIKPGRGNRRRYHIIQISYLLATRALADVGVPISDALALGQSLSNRVMGWLLECEDLTPQEAAIKLSDESHPWIGVFALEGSKYEGVRVGHVTYTPTLVVSAEEYAYLQLFDTDSIKGIRELMRDQALESISIIDTVFLAVKILDAALEIAKTRK